MRTTADATHCAARLRLRGRRRSPARKPRGCARSSPASSCRSGWLQPSHAGFRVFPAMRRSTAASPSTLPRSNANPFTPSWTNSVMPATSDTMTGVWLASAFNRTSGLFSYQRDGITSASMPSSTRASPPAETFRETARASPAASSLQPRAVFRVLGQRSHDPDFVRAQGRASAAPPRSGCRGPCAPLIWPTNPSTDCRGSVLRLFPARDKSTPNGMFVIRAAIAVALVCLRE